MPPAYLTTQAATARLAAYGIESSPSDAVLRLASDDLDQEAPFVGEKLDPLNQHRQFPRDVTVQDDAPSTVPGRVLDWVALKAHRYDLDDDSPHVLEKIDKITIQYRTRGKIAREVRLMKNLIKPYKRFNAARIA